MYLQYFFLFFMMQRTTATKVCCGGALECHLSERHCNAHYHTAKVWVGQKYEHFIFLDTPFISFHATQYTYFFVGFSDFFGCPYIALRECDDYFQVFSYHSDSILHILVMSKRNSSFNAAYTPCLLCQNIPQWIAVWKICFY